MGFWTWFDHQIGGFFNSCVTWWPWYKGGCN